MEQDTNNPTVSATSNATAEVATAERLARLDLAEQAEWDMEHDGERFEPQ